MVKFLQTISITILLNTLNNSAICKAYEEKSMLAIFIID